MDDLFVGFCGAWDSMSYPRVAEWPLPERQEQEILASYAKMVRGCYTSYEAWQRARVEGRLWGYHASASVPSDTTLHEIFLVMSMVPEFVSWERTGGYRLEIDVPHRYGKAYASLQEAELAAAELTRENPNSRFAVVRVPVLA